MIGAPEICVICHGRMIGTQEVLGFRASSWQQGSSIDERRYGLQKGTGGGGGGEGEPSSEHEFTWAKESLS